MRNPFKRQPELKPRRALAQLRQEAYLRGESVPPDPRELRGWGGPVRSGSGTPPGSILRALTRQRQHPRQTRTGGGVPMTRREVRRRNGQLDCDKLTVRP